MKDRMMTTLSIVISTLHNAGDHSVTGTGWSGYLMLSAQCLHNLNTAVLSPHHPQDAGNPGTRRAAARRTEGLELQTKDKRRFAKISQLRREPLLGPSHYTKRALAVITNLHADLRLKLEEGCRHHGAAAAAAGEPRPAAARPRRLHPPRLGGGSGRGARLRAGHHAGRAAGEL